MTMKDFELIARVLRESTHPEGTLWTSDKPTFVDRGSLAKAFADELAKTNPRFKRDVFMRACGVGVES